MSNSRPVSASSIELDARDENAALPTRSGQVPRRRYMSVKQIPRSRNDIRDTTNALRLGWHWGEDAGERAGSEDHSPVRQAQHKQEWLCHER